MKVKNSENSLFIQLKAAKKEKKELLIHQFNQHYEINNEANRNRKHPALLTCPHCHQQGKTIRYGFMDAEKKRQRFKCKACQQHFNDCTDTLFHNRKLSKHLPAFLKLMLDGKSIREIADILNISPTTVHKWRHLVLNYIERHMSSFGNDLSSREIITETSIKEINPSKKGLPRNYPIFPFTQSIQFQYNRLGIFSVIITSHQILKPKQQLIKAERTLYKNSKSLSKKELSSADRHLLYHYNHVEHFQNKFIDMHQQMRGVAQPYLHQYVHWFCYVERISKLSPQEKLKDLIRICS